MKNYYFWYAFVNPRMGRDRLSHFVRFGRSLILSLCLMTLLTIADPPTAFAIPHSPARSAPPPLLRPTPSYQQRPASRDGIGKVYLGREIAQVMGHLGAGWLERPTRQWEEQPQRLLEALNFKPTDVVAEIGAGTGYISFQIGSLVPQGKVLAVDVQPEMVEILDALKQERQIQNVEPILGTETDPGLAPTSVDWVLMVDAYHEFVYPKEMMAAITQSLKPKGRVVLVEYRGENPLVPIKALHKMTQRQVRKEMAAVGFTWQETNNVLPQQHIMIFRGKHDES